MAKGFSGRPDRRRSGIGQGQGQGHMNRGYVMDNDDYDIDSINDRAMGGGSTDRIIIPAKTASFGAPSHPLATSEARRSGNHGYQDRPVARPHRRLPQVPLNVAPWTPPVASAADINNYIRRSGIDNDAFSDVSNEVIRISVAGAGSGRRSNGVSHQAGRSNQRRMSMMKRLRSKLPSQYRHHRQPPHHQLLPSHQLHNSSGSRPSRRDIYSVHDDIPVVYDNRAYAHEDNTWF